VCAQNPSTFEIRRRHHHHNRSQRIEYYFVDRRRAMNAHPPRTMVTGDIENIDPNRDAVTATATATAESESAKRSFPPTVIVLPAMMMNTTSTTDGAAAAAAESMNAHPPTMVNTTTTGVSLVTDNLPSVEINFESNSEATTTESAPAPAPPIMIDTTTTTTTTATNDNDELKAWILNILQLNESMTRSEQQLTVINEVALRALENRAENGGRRVQYGSHNVVNKINKVLRKRAVPQISKSDISNRMTQIQKDRMNAEFQAAMNEVVERGIEEKKKNGGNMTAGWYEEEAKQWNRRKPHPPGNKTISKNALKHRVGRLWKRLQNGSSISNTATAVAPPPTVPVALAPSPLAIHSPSIPLPPTPQSYNTDLAFEDPSPCSESALTM
jgi:hypothetical protein